MSARLITQPSPLEAVQIVASYLRGVSASSRREFIELVTPILESYEQDEVES